MLYTVFDKNSTFPYTATPDFGLKYAFCPLSYWRARAVTNRSPPLIPLTTRTPMDNTDILSIQLYTLRSLGELDRVLDAVKQAGYVHVETVGSHLDEAENVRAKLDARGLKVSSSHVSLVALREQPDVVVRACRTLGCDQLFMP